VKRLSIRDGTFYPYGDTIDVVIINAGPVSREYFSHEFDATQTKSATCWSVDTQRPAEAVPDEHKQAARCLDCKHNIRGSSGYGRACRFFQRLAIAFKDELDVIYQLQLPATSIFGKARGSDMPLQEYVRHLSKHNTAATSVVTKIYFDKGHSLPKLFFRPVQGLDKEQLETVSALVNHPDVYEAITSAERPSATASPFDSVEGYAFK
jgi:hypothetical protein